MTNMAPESARDCTAGGRQRNRTENAVASVPTDKGTSDASDVSVMSTIMPSTILSRAQHQSGIERG